MAFSTVFTSGVKGGRCSQKTPCTGSGAEAAWLSSQPLTTHQSFQSFRLFEINSAESQTQGKGVRIPNPTQNELKIRMRVRPRFFLFFNHF